MMRLVELNSRSLDFLPDQKNSKSLKRALSPSSARIFCCRHVAKDTEQLSDSGIRSRLLEEIEDRRDLSSHIEPLSTFLLIMNSVQAKISPVRSPKVPQGAFPSLGANFCS